MTVQQVISKASYTAPKLVVYGGMATLTASGSNTGKENTGSMATSMA